MENLFLYLVECFNFDNFFYFDFMSLQGNPKLFNIVKNNRVDELQKELNGNVTTLQDTSYELEYVPI